MVDEPDQETEFLSDPFLDAGIDIPKEHPYFITPHTTKPKTLKQRLCSKLSGSNNKNSSDDVELEASINLPLRADESGDNIYGESMPSLKYLDTIDSRPLSLDEQGMTRVLSNNYHFDTIRHWDELRKSLAEI